MKVMKNIQKFFFDQAYKKWVKASTTVEPRSNGPAPNGIPLITDANS